MGTGPRSGPPPASPPTSLSPTMRRPHGNSPPATAWRRTPGRPTVLSQSSVTDSLFPVRELPVWPDEMAGVAVGIALEVVLMLRLRLPEPPRRLHLGDHLPRPPRQRG